MIVPLGKEIPVFLYNNMLVNFFSSLYMSILEVSLKDKNNESLLIIFLLIDIELT